jgi:hypothetical protein
LSRIVSSFSYTQSAARFGFVLRAGGLVCIYTSRDTLSAMIVATVLNE